LIEGKRGGDEGVFIRPGSASVLRGGEAVVFARRVGESVEMGTSEEGRN
jgi:hypothetical protein